MTDPLSAAEETIRLGKEATRAPWKYVPMHVAEGPSEVRKDDWLLCTAPSDADAEFIAHLGTYGVSISEALLEAQKRIDGLEKAAQEACDLLAERTYASHVRSCEKIARDIGEKYHGGPLAICNEVADAIASLSLEDLSHYSSDGVNVSGDGKSIQRVAEWHHAHMILPQLRERVAALSASPPGDGGVRDEGHPHLINGEFQSDKYPTCPRGKVPLSVKDKAAQDLLAIYAERRRAVDNEFADDLLQALLNVGYAPVSSPTTDAVERVAKAIAEYVRTTPAHERVSYEGHARAALSAMQGEKAPDDLRIRIDKIIQDTGTVYVTSASATDAIMALLPAQDAIWNEAIEQAAKFSDAVAASAATRLAEFGPIVKGVTAQSTIDEWVEWRRTEARAKSNADMIRSLKASC